MNGHDIRIYASLGKMNGHDFRICVSLGKKIYASLGKNEWARVQNIC